MPLILPIPTLCIKIFIGVIKTHPIPQPHHLRTEICRTTGSLPSASCQPTATLVMSGTTVRLVDKVVLLDKEEEEEVGLGTG